MSKTNAAFSGMNSEQIRARLLTLDELQAQLSARDFDAELQAAFLRGEDVESLADLQLQAEKQARLLRVERKVLENALPDAIKKDSQPLIDDLAAQHRKLASDAVATSKRVTSIWQELSGELDQWMTHRRRSVELTHQAAQIASDAGLPMPSLGAFTDRNLMAVIGDIKDARGRLGTAAEHGDGRFPAHPLTH